MRRLFAALVVVVSAGPSLRVAALNPLPPNDNFAKAIAVSSLPFDDELESYATTFELGETRCRNVAAEGTLWYALSFAVPTAVLITTEGSTRTNQVAAYTGTSLDNLRVIECDEGYWDDPARIGIKVVPGTTYYVQLSNSDRGHLEIHMRLASKIAGTITDDSGNPVDGACAIAEGGGWYRRVSAAADGRYLLEPLPPGAYRVEFRDCNGGRFATQFYDGVESWGDATLVAVGDRDSIDGIDASLRRLSTVSGFVTGPDGAPLAEICVSLRTVDLPDSFGSDRTDSDGRYSAGVHRAGRYTVSFYDCSPPYTFRLQDYPGVYDPGDRVPVEVGDLTDTDGIDAVMMPLVRPANDEKATATGIGSLPFSDATNLELATAEPTEYGSCIALLRPSRTVWYRYTAARQERIVVDTSGSREYAFQLAAYKITPVGNVEIACASSRIENPSMSFVTEPGTSYLFQACTTHGRELRFHVRAAGPSAG